MSPGSEGRSWTSEKSEKSARAPDWEEEVREREKRRETHQFRIKLSLLCTLVSESYSTEFRTKLEILDVGHVWGSEIVLGVVGFRSSGLEGRRSKEAIDVSDELWIHVYLS